jgi:hypothetical protein
MRDGHPSHVTHAAHPKDFREENRKSNTIYKRMLNCVRERMRQTREGIGELGKKWCDMHLTNFGLYVCVTDSTEIFRTQDG